MRLGRHRRMFVGWTGVLLFIAVAPAWAQTCGQPRSWRQIYLHAGDPRAEVFACLKDHAWDVRRLKVPLRSAAAGIVAQCEVDVTFFAGPQGSDARFRAEREINGVDAEIVAEATADVVHYRSCLG